MMTIARSLALLLPLALSTALAAGLDSMNGAQEAAAAKPPPAELEIRVEPFLDLYYELRARAADDDPAAAGADERLAPAVQAMRSLDRELGGMLAWGPIDGLVADCRDVAALERACAGLPETLRVRRPGGGAGEVRARERALAISSAIAPLAAEWEERAWPERRERIEAAADDLREMLCGARGAAMYAELCDALDVSVEAERVPLVLVLRAPDPGAVTYRRAGGGGVCIVGVEGLAGSLLAEVALHESIHALDVVSTEQDTLLWALRRALADAGIAVDDRRARDVPHALFFVAAGELVRRRIDPKHVDYGEREGVYGRLAAPIEVERALWRDYLDGKIERDELVGRIAEAAAE